MNLLEDKVRTLVFNTLKEFGLPKTAGEPLVWVIMSTWQNYGHLNWFSINSIRARTLEQSDPSTLCLAKCLTTIQNYPHRHFSSLEIKKESNEKPKLIPQRPQETQEDPRGIVEYDPILPDGCTEYSDEGQAWLRERGGEPAEVSQANP